MVRVSYKSHKVSNFHSSFSTATKNCFNPSNVNSSLKKVILVLTEINKRWNYFIVTFNLPFDNNSDRISHEFVGHLQNFIWQSCTQQYNLNIIKILIKVSVFLNQLFQKQLCFFFFNNTHNVELVNFYQHTLNCIESIWLFMKKFIM